MAIQINNQINPLSYGIPYYNNIDVLQSRFIPPKMIKVPVEWRTWKQRFFSLPWNPGELFIYKTININQMILFGDKILCDPSTYNIIKNTGFKYGLES